MKPSARVDAARFVEDLGDVPAFFEHGQAQGLVLDSDCAPAAVIHTGHVAAIMTVRVRDDCACSGRELISRRATLGCRQSLRELSLALRFWRINGVLCRDLGAINPNRGRFSQRNAHGSAR